MTRPPDPDRNPGAALTAAIGAVSIVGIGLSLTVALLSVRLEQEGYSARAIGLNPAAGGLATLAGAPLVPMLARKVGVQRLLLASILISAASLIGFAATSDYWAWLVLRIVFGAALTVLFVLSEFWINAAAHPQRRGIVMGLYTTSLALGFAAGPLLLTLTGTRSLAPFAAAFALFVLAAVPVALAGGAAPQLSPDAAHVPVLRFLAGAPVATLAALLYGAVETAVMGLLPVYGLRGDLSAEQAAGLVSLFAMGNVAFQLPIGLLSDRMDRRRLLFGIGLFSLLGALALPFAARLDFRLFCAVLFIWGGVTGSLYAVGLAHLCARCQGAELASANAAYIMLYSVGMLAGPPILGIGLDLTPQGLFFGIALLFALYLGIALARIGRPSLT